jgi:hypothetical protein
MGHENAEGMAHVGVRVEPPVRLGSEGTELHLFYEFVAWFHLRWVPKAPDGTIHLVNRFLRTHHWTVACVQLSNGVASRTACYGHSLGCRIDRGLRGTLVPTEVRQRSEALCTE